MKLRKLQASNWQKIKKPEPQLLGCQLAYNQAFPLLHYKPNQMKPTNQTKECKQTGVEQRVAVYRGFLQVRNQPLSLGL